MKKRDIKKTLDIMDFLLNNQKNIISILKDLEKRIKALEEKEQNENTEEHL